MRTVQRRSEVAARTILGKNQSVEFSLVTLVFSVGRFQIVIGHVGQIHGNLDALDLDLCFAVSALMCFLTAAAG